MSPVLLPEVNINLWCGWVGLSDYSEISNKHGAHLILFEKFFLPACLIRTYTFIYFSGKLPPTWLLEPPRLFIFKKKSWLLLFLSKMKQILPTYTINNFLEKILPTQLLEPPPLFLKFFLPSRLIKPSCCLIIEFFLPTHY